MISWELDNNVLILKCFETEVIPTAKEIFNVVFKGENTIRGMKVPTKFPQIKFSKFPVDLKIVLRSNYEDEKSELDLRIALVYQNELLKIIEFTSEMPEHIVVNNTWYPITAGEVEYINKILFMADIQTGGRISLKQYLALKRSIDDTSKLFDEIPNGIKNLSKDISKVGDISSFFTGNLYRYQMDGYNWLKMIAHEDAGCILGDQMGLGKTIQIIALLAAEKSDLRRPSLVVVPPTLMENWRREIIKFSPDIYFLIHKGQYRTGFHSVLSKYDVVITSYETVLIDLPMFKMIKWNLIVLDEAHFIKNPVAKRTIALKQLRRRVAIAMTGTPIQNRLIDLWSVVDFVLPGYLGKLQFFESQYADDKQSAEKLEQLVSPIILRRLVSEVADDLPERIDVPQAVEMLDNEAAEYEEIRKNIVAAYGKSAGLISLIALRMYCTHPFLINNGTGDPAEASMKYQRLIEILQEIIGCGEKVLIFTSFTKMINILVKDISTRLGVYCNFIDGRVGIDERQNIIDYFGNISGGAVLILNPRAAGVGLNITAANHVIHYNLEWNPAVEDQASARAYRRGQTLPVTVHRLFYANTVEEVVNMRINNKRDIANSAVVGHDGINEDYNDILKAINISPTEGRKENGN